MDLLNNAYSRLLSGGIYMVPIFLLSVIILTLFFFKGVTLYFVFRELKTLFVHGLQSIDPAGKWNIRAREYQTFRCGIEKLDMELREQLSNELAGRLGPGNGILFCAALATLLGLLGTVSGMITSFDAIHQYGVGNTKTMASGISQALITTQSGLLVSIVGVLLGRLLSSITRRLKNNILKFYTLLEQNI